MYERRSTNSSAPRARGPLRYQWFASFISIFSLSSVGDRSRASLPLLLLDLTHSISGGGSASCNPCRHLFRLNRAHRRTDKRRLPSRRRRGRSSVIPLPGILRFFSVGSSLHQFLSARSVLWGVTTDFSVVPLVDGQLATRSRFFRRGPLARVLSRPRVSAMRVQQRQRDADRSARLIPTLVLFTTCHAARPREPNAYRFTSNVARDRRRLRVRVASAGAAFAPRRDVARDLGGGPSLHALRPSRNGIGEITIGMALSVSGLLLVAGSVLAAFTVDARWANDDRQHHPLPASPPCSRRSRDWRLISRLHARHHVTAFIIYAFIPRQHVRHRAAGQAARSPSSSSPAAPRRAALGDRRRGIQLRRVRGRGRAFAFAAIGAFTPLRSYAAEGKSNRHLWWTRPRKFLDLAFHISRADRTRGLAHPR
jgi:hypothetical protein